MTDQNRARNVQAQRRATTPAADFTIRFYQAGDEGLINAFYNDPSQRPGAGVCGVPARTNSEWIWEFASHNQDSGIPYSLAFDQERLVGIQGFLPIQLIHDGRVELSEKSEDTLVSPEYRGKGLLDQMYRMLFERALQRGVVVQWGFTSTAVKPLIRSGFKSLGKVDFYRLNLSARAVAASILRHTSPGLPRAEAFANAVLRFPQIIRSSGVSLIRRFFPRPMPPGMEVVELTKLDEVCDQFSARFSRAYPGISVHFSGSYLHWRCFKNPYFRYRVYAANHGGEMVGLAVFKIDDRSRMGIVSALAAIPTETQGASIVLNALLETGLRVFARHGCRSAVAWCFWSHAFSNLVRDSLKKVGFFNFAADTDFMVRAVTSNDPSYLNPNNWFICEIMSER